MKQTWREIQRKNFTRLNDLLDYLEFDQSSRAHFSKTPAFPLNLPLRLAQKIEKNTLSDPILRQFVPLIEEEKQVAGFVVDSVGDCGARREDKLLQKYSSRALLVTTAACAMNCRFCFRQHFDYSQNRGFEKELEQIAKDENLKEVILSGGDPLSLSDEVLKTLLNNLSEIPHIQLIRFHTRFPIGIPERIDDSFLSALSEVRPQVIFVSHINHPREVDEDVIEALKKVQKLGIPLLNHSVLLKGVNDNVETLRELFLKLISNAVMPYYLNQLDRVQGAAHFEVDEMRGKELVRQLQERLPGYGVPKYIREIAGQKSKTLLL